MVGCAHTGHIKDLREEIQALQIMAGPECHARKCGQYPVGNGESLNDFEQNVTQSAPCSRQVLWEMSSKVRFKSGEQGEGEQERR